MKKAMFIFAVAIAFIVSSNAQLKVYTSGNVGINATEPLSLFSVGGNGFADSRSTFHNTNTANNQKALRVYKTIPTQSYYAYGLFSSIEPGESRGILVGLFSTAYRGATPYSKGQTCGVRAQAGNATTGYNYGLLAEIVGANNGAAIYATVPGKGIAGTDGMYSGYFRGNVKMEDDLNVAGLFTNSDINLKKEVENLDSDNVKKLLQLQAIKYKLKTPAELSAFSKESSDTAKVEDIKKYENDPTYNRDYIGISAQELQKVYPEIVKTEEDGFLSVNYIELIPVLIEAIKEQQAEIKRLEDKISVFIENKGAN